MKKSVFVIIAVCAAVIAAAAIAVGAYLSGRSDNNDTGVSAIWDYTKEYSDPLDENTSLTETQSREIAKLYERTDPAFERFPFQERVIMGNIAADAPRMTLETAKRIVAEGGDDMWEIVREFEKIQPADAVGGSGVTHVIFNLDDNDGIFFLVEQGDITYLRFASDGTVEYSEELRL